MDEAKSCSNRILINLINIWISRYTYKPVAYSNSNASCNIASLKKSVINVCTEKASSAIRRGYFPSLINAFVFLFHIRYIIGILALLTHITHICQQKSTSTTLYHVVTILSEDELSHLTPGAWPLCYYFKQTCGMWIVTSDSETWNGL